MRRLISWIRSRQTSKEFSTHHRDIMLVKEVRGQRFPRWAQLLHLPKVASPQERRMLAFGAFLVFCGILSGSIIVINRYRVDMPAVGGRYVEGMVGSPQLINPIFAAVNDADMDISRLAYSGLLRYDSHQRLVPDLAARYEVSADKKTYLFELRQDIVWHDAESFTAKDVAFTIETIQNPSVGSPLLVSFQGVAVDVVDDYTIRFTLQEPFLPFLSTLTVGIIPEHIWGDFPADQMRLAGRNLQPIGTGPFRFEKINKDDTGFITLYELRRFERYYREPAFIEEFAFQFYREYDGGEGAIQALREKKADGLAFVPYALRDRVLRKHIRLHTLQLPQYTAIFFHQKEEPALAEGELRAALALALDRDRIVRESIKGEGHVIESPVLSGFPGYLPELAKTPYAPDEANTKLDALWERVPADAYRAIRKELLMKERIAMLLAAATSTGAAAVASSTLYVASTSVDVALTEDARREAEADIERELNLELHEAQTFYRKNKEGVFLDIRLVTADTPEYRQAAQLIAGFWQEIGVKTSLRFVPPKEMAREVVRGRNYEAFLYGAIVGGDPDQYPFWHSSQADFPGLNLARYANKNADALLEKTRTSTNEAEIADLYVKFQEILLSERPALFLYTPTYTYATGDRVNGIELSSVFHPSDRFTDVTHWYIKTDGEWRF